MPRRDDIRLYKQIGINVEQMLSMHLYFSGNRTLEAIENADDKATELKHKLHCSDIIS